MTLLPRRLTEFADTKHTHVAGPTRRCVRRPTLRARRCVFAMLCALVATSRASAARAQTLSAHAVSVPPGDSGPAATAAPDRAGPTVPDELRPAFLRLRALVPHTADCWFGTARSRPHTPPEGCLAWHERLTQSGTAATHAIGRYLATPEPREVRRWTGPVADEVLPRLVRILALRRTYDTAWYLAAFLHRVLDLARPDDVRVASGAAIDELRRLTSMDFEPRAPWGDFDQRYADSALRRAVMRQWSEWVLERASGDLEALRALGREHARRDLVATAVGTRLNAISRLARSREDRESLRTATQTLFADATLASDDRVQLEQLARRFGFAPRR